MSAGRWGSVVARYVPEMGERWMHPCEWMPRALAWQSLQGRIRRGEGQVGPLMREGLKGWRLRCVRPRIAPLRHIVRLATMC